MNHESRKPFSIAGRAIGPAEPVYVVAELSANHNGDFDRAVKLIEAAGHCGVDAVKMQTYTPDTMTIRSDRPEFSISGGTPWDDRTLYDLYRAAHTPWSWQPRLKAAAEHLGLAWFSTAYDTTAVDFLEQLDVPAYKVASFELVDLPLIERIAATGKPMILSTGMATLEEIGEAVDAAQRAGARQIALLKCTSAYPAEPEEMNLNTIGHLSDKFDLPVGLSDHTLGSAVAVAAVVLGAPIVEKHLCLARDGSGLDVSFSATPDELERLVLDVHTAKRAMGTVCLGPSPGEEPGRAFRRSLFVVAEVAAGDPFTSANVRSIRPGHGLAPKHLSQIIGRRAAKDIPEGTPLAWEMVER